MLISVEDILSVIGGPQLENRRHDSVLLPFAFPCASLPIAITSHVTPAVVGFFFRSLISFLPACHPGGMTIFWKCPNW